MSTHQLDRVQTPARNGTFGGRAPVWFAFDETRPTACFAGIWTPWTSVRKVKKGQTTNGILGLLTINPNAEVGAIHRKASGGRLFTKSTRTNSVRRQSD